MVPSFQQKATMKLGIPQADALLKYWMLRCLLEIMGIEIQHQEGICLGKAELAETTKVIRYHQRSPGTCPSHFPAFPWPSCLGQQSAVICSVAHSTSVAVDSSPV